MPARPAAALRIWRRPAEGSPASIAFVISEAAPLIPGHRPHPSDLGTSAPRDRAPPRPADRQSIACNMNCNSSNKKSCGSRTAGAAGRDATGVDLGGDGVAAVAAARPRHGEALDRMEMAAKASGSRAVIRSADAQRTAQDVGRRSRLSIRQRRRRALSPGDDAGSDCHARVRRCCERRTAPWS